MKHQQRVRRSKITTKITIENSNKSSPITGIEEEEASLPPPPLECRSFEDDEEDIISIPSETNQIKAPSPTSSVETPSIEDSEDFKQLSSLVKKIVSFCL